MVQQGERPGSGVKEQQVRALREQRFKRRNMAPVTIEAPVTDRNKPLRGVTPCYSHDVTQSDLIARNRYLEAQLVHLEAEVKWLKEQLAKAANGHPPLTAAERMRKMRERKRHGK